MQNNKTLNIGAGTKLLSGAVNVDIIPGEGITVCDIRKGLPFDDESFSDVIADYVLCQICDKNDFVKVMNEIWRVLKVGGLLKMKVPDARFPCAFQDPMDCRYFVQETFDYFDQDHYRYKAFNYGFKPWEIVKVEKERTDRIYAELKKPDVKS